MHLLFLICCIIVRQYSAVYKVAHFFVSQVLQSLQFPTSLVHHLQHCTVIANHFKFCVDCVVHSLLLCADLQDIDRDIFRRDLAETRY